MAPQEMPEELAPTTEAQGRDPVMVVLMLEALMEALTLVARLQDPGAVDLRPLGLAGQAVRVVLTEEQTCPEDKAVAWETGTVEAAAVACKPKIDPFPCPGA